jgi:hypothetical protein
MDIDIDSNDGGEDYIFQLSDDKFFAVVFVNKQAFAQTWQALAALRENDEVVLGTISDGTRVWLWRDDGAEYWLALGDTDSKDVCYRLTADDVDALVRARPD